jgi:hypothetical protein
MRVLIATGLACIALASLGACNKAPSATASGAASAAATTPAASSPISLQDLPHRKAGLWRQTMAMQGVDRTMPAVQACTDAASEAKLSLLGQHKNKDLCQDQQFSRNLDGSINFSVSCDLGPRGKTVSTGTITGDFNSSYKIAMDSTTSGSPAAPANGERKMTITATWLGPCAPGQRGGDMIMADGRKVNLTDPSPGSGYP